jgi:hypothetical protein
VLNRLRPEGGEQGAKTLPFLESPKPRCRLRNSASESENPIALADAERPENVRKLVGEPIQIAVAEIARFALFAEPAQRQLSLGAGRCAWRSTPRKRC